MDCIAEDKGSFGSLGGEDGTAMFRGSCSLSAGVDVGVSCVGAEEEVG